MMSMIVHLDGSIEWAEIPCVHRYGFFSRAVRTSMEASVDVEPKHMEFKAIHFRWSGRNRENFDVFHEVAP